MEYPHNRPYTADDLVRIITLLRDPVNGCPWDKVQTHTSIRMNFLEEAYEAVDALADYLTDKELSGPASRALARIATPAAGEALMAGLKSRVAMGAKAKRDMVNAIGEAKVAGAEELLLTFVGSQDIDLQKTVLYALSQVGGEASLKVLGDAAAQAGYTMEKSGANEAYIELIKNIAAKGNVAAAEKAAKDLQKKAEKASQLQTREAALKILLSLKGNKDATKMLLAALKVF